MALKHGADCGGEYVPRANGVALAKVRRGS